MDKRLMELLEKEFITLEELEEIRKNSNINGIDNLGNSKEHIGYTMFMATVASEGGMNYYLLAKDK